ncbi:unnamed protein product [Prunus armeniaca]
MLRSWKPSSIATNERGVPAKKHFNAQNALLEFAGTLHHLTIEAIDAGKKKLYEAKVWMKPWPWMGFKEVQEFKHAAEICMNMECTRVAIRTGFSKSDAEQKYEKTHEDMPSFLPKGDALPKGQPPAEAPNCQTLNTGDTCHHHSNLHKVPHRNFVQTSYFYFPINRNTQLAPSPIRPHRLFFTPHSAMPTEDSRDAQRNTPQEGTSQRGPSAEVNLQAEVELLRAGVVKMSERCDHLHYRNVELEHDYRILKRNWERNQAQGSQRSLTQEPERTQPNQPEHSHHSPPIQPRPSKGKDPLHPETTKSRLLRISPPRNWPHEPTKVYRDCRDRILDRQTGPLLIPVNLQDPKTDRLYSADDLYMLRQGEDEPLREYAARFSHEYSRCPETDDRAAFGAFKSGLRESNFRYLVHNNSWNTYAKLMKQAAVHAKAEYFNSKRGPAPPAHHPFADPPPASAPTSAPPQHSTPAPSTQGTQHPKRKDNYQHTFNNNKRGRHNNHHQSSGVNSHRAGDRAPLPFSPKPRFEVFTILNTTYENVLVHEAPIIHKPPPQRPGSKPMPNTGVFCRFHQFGGHDTESCVALRNIIEGLIRDGKLDKYVHNLPPPPNPHQRQINMISTISGGPTLAGTSNNSIKHYVCSTYAHQVFSAEQGRLPKTHKSGWAPITFCEEEERGVILPHNDPIIIRADISNFDVGRILVDTGSSVSVMFAEAFNELQVPYHLLDRSITPLVSFSAYNVILGRPAMAQMKVFISTHMLLLKFPTPHGTGTVRGDQLGARSCYASAVRSTNRQHRGEALVVTQAPAPVQAGTERPEDPRKESVTPQAEPVEDLELVTLDENIPDRQVRIGTSLSQELRSDLVAFLRLNSEVFAWSYNDMPGISPEIISHRLSINLAVRQKRRAYDPELYEAMRAEVDKLTSIGFIKEVDYPTWLANVVMVRKGIKGWRMCVDYTNLNRACPKDSFPLPRIDQLVDATAGHDLLSFMDAYSGYNQIFMHPKDQAHTSFITDRGLYCYKVMPFGLKNAGATYQRLVNAIFAPLIGNTMEVYVDDMLVKSRTTDQHIPNLSAMFTILKQYKMRLNPTKCAFGVASGKFLGFMISQRGIEANPEKIKAILDMTIPRTIKDIQSLTGRVAALTRFISKATDRCAPFFKALEGSKRSITWTAECNKAFNELLMIYLSISATAVSSVLIQTKNGAEHPVHYVSKALQDAEVRYPDIEKLAFALVVSARRLRPYFQAHTIHVLTNQPLRQVLLKPETSGRLVKWAIELGEFDIHYKPRLAMKGQAVADFISEFTEHHAVASPQITMDPTPTPSQAHVASNGTLDLTQPLWTLYVDGSSNAQGCGAGLVLISPDKAVLEYAPCFQFHASNNEAKYEALLAGLRLAKEMGARQIQIFSDSQLVVHQVNQDFTAKDVSMTAYLQHTRHLLTTFNAYFISQLSTQTPLICAIDHSPTWMDPILQFLQNQTLPADPAEAQRVRYRSARYLIINGALYKRGFSLPYLRCLTPEEGHYVLREIHEGICGSHSGARSLAHKVIRQGYFWPSLHTDAQAFTQKCDKCQRFANIPQLPAEPLTAMVSPWPFAQWGLDLIGPMPEGKGQVKYAVVAVDYFTKWAEAEALAIITAARIEAFVWQNIVCRFGIPNAIVTDNGRQFDNAKFRQFCSNLKIKLCFSSPTHPQSNGQVEAVNKIIKKTLKTKLDKAKGCWPELLPEVLWAYRTTFRTSTGETPFSLSFGTEAVAPVEIGQPTYRTSTYEAEANNEQLALNLDFIDELRDQSNMRNVAYKQRIAKYYNSRVKPRAFTTGDWVMRKVSLATKNPNEGTLGPTWEGPYEITKVCRPGTYQLRDPKGKTLPHPRNADHLKYYYK